MQADANVLQERSFMGYHLSVAIKKFQIGCKAGGIAVRPDCAVALGASAISLSYVEPH